MKKQKVNCVLRLLPGNGSLSVEGAGRFASGEERKVTIATLLRRQLEQDSQFEVRDLPKPKPGKAAAKTPEK